MFIVGMEMDYVDNDIKSEFVFNNPNAKGTCGCGESFHVWNTSITKNLEFIIKSVKIRNKINFIIQNQKRIFLFWTINKKITKL